MPKPFAPKIVSANTLRRGDVVYLNKDHRWSRKLEDACVVHTKEDADELLAAADQPEIVVGPYLLDVAVTENGAPRPTHFRETFRERGPTIRPDLGRQAGQFPTASLKLVESV